MKSWFEIIISNYLSNVDLKLNCMSKYMLSGYGWNLLRTHGWGYIKKLRNIGGDLKSKLRIVIDMKSFSVTMYITLYIMYHTTILINIHVIHKYTEIYAHILGQLTKFSSIFHKNFHCTSRCISCISLNISHIFFVNIHKYTWYTCDINIFKDEKDHGGCNNVGEASHQGAKIK